MVIDVKIPPMGESISSGILAKWHVKDGDTVKKDQPLFELETDKITSEGTAEAAGKISFKAPEGAEVKIGQVVAAIDTEAAVDTAPAVAAPAAAPAAAPVAAAPAAAPAAPSNSKPGTPNPKPQVTESPAVRRLAGETGIDPATVAGSGKGGRVTKGDMLAITDKPGQTAPIPAAPASVLPAPVAGASGPGPGSPSPATTSLPTAASAAAARSTRKKMTPLRQKIAQRLVEAQHNAAMLTTFNEADMSAVMALRAKYQDEFVKKNGLKLGFMSFFVKAVVHALKEVPGINAFIDGDSLIQHSYYDIGVAVSTEKGLMVPVIRGCDQLSFAGIEKKIGEAATKAREGKITLPDLEGGTFTITNGGVFGSMLSTPILNAPQSGILGMHSIIERPVAVGGQVVIRPMMYLALSYDHRVVDGREAVTFLVKVKQAIEDPARLVLSV